MKINFALSIGLLILATTTQGFLLKSAIKKKLPLLVPALSGLASSIKQQPQISAPSSQVLSSEIAPSSSSGTSSLSEQINESFESPLSAPIAPTVTLYEYPPHQQQVIYRTIRPVVRRTVYVQAPTYSEGALRNAIGSLIPGQSSISGALAGVISKLSPITGALTGLKSAVQSTLSAPARATLVSSAPPAVAVPAPQVYYLY